MVVRAVHKRVGSCVFAVLSGGGADVTDSEYLQCALNDVWSAGFGLHAKQLCVTSPRLFPSCFFPPPFVPALGSGLGWLVEAGWK